MADIELVIRISEEEYEECKQYGYETNYYERAIANGTPLPKGHGDLVYRNDVKHKINQDCLTFERDLNEDVNPAKAIMECLIAINEVKTIIEADTEEREE